MNLKTRQLKKQGFISGVKVGNYIYQELGFNGANKEYYYIFNLLRNFKSTVVIDSKGDNRGRKYYFLEKDVLMVIEKLKEHREKDGV